MNSNKELIKKIKALAEGGTGGEKKNAEALLNKLMKKYNISYDEIDDDIVEEEAFKYRDQQQKILLIQVIYKVTNEKGKSWTYKNKRNTLFAKVTKAQKIEIECFYDWYKRQWIKERDLFFSAFIQKHSIFGKLKDGESGKELSDEEMLKMLQMINSMEDVSPTLAIAGEKR